MGWRMRPLRPSPGPPGPILEDPQASFHLGEEGWGGGKGSGPAIFLLPRARRSALASASLQILCSPGRVESHAACRWEGLTEPAGLQAPLVSADHQSTRLLRDWVWIQVTSPPPDHPA